MAHPAVLWHHHGRALAHLEAHLLLLLQQPRQVLGCFSKRCVYQVFSNSLSSRPHIFFLVFDVVYYVWDLIIYILR